MDSIQFRDGVRDEEHFPGQSWPVARSYWYFPAQPYTPCVPPRPRRSGWPTLAEETHIHGLAVDRQGSPDILIATHHGLFRAGPDGEAERISVVQDFMGFNPHPTDADVLYASGHPAEGGGLGFIRSGDQGATWEQVSPGANGPVDFHQMTVSPADPQVIYGAYGGLQVSRDAGRTWTVVGPLPDRLIDLAASAEDPDTVFAATEGGLLVSRDAGSSWEPVLEGSPVSLVEVTADGTLYAFVLGRGLVRSDESNLAFADVSGGWGDAFLLHLAVDPANPDKIYAATQQGSIVTSGDRGETWVPFGT